MSEMIQDILKRDTRALAKAITLIENGAPEAESLLSALYKQSGRAHIIGVTGSPGAGKSTLVDEIAANFTKNGKTVAILAVDPSSPFSGGAILGDRIRMNKVAEDKSIYLRSMATRGALGGLSRATIDATIVLDAAGFDIILVETVGVGQAEIDIVRLADSCLVVLVPGMGDSVQAFKAGILEIADLFIINKADREGADLLHRDLRSLISLGEYNDSDWTPAIVNSIATKGEGVDTIAQTIGQHAEWLKQGENGKLRKILTVKESILKLCGDLVSKKITDSKTDELNKLVELCINKAEDPYSAARKLLAA